MYRASFRNADANCQERVDKEYIHGTGARLSGHNKSGKEDERELEPGKHACLFGPRGSRGLRGVLRNHNLPVWFAPVIRTHYLTEWPRSLCTFVLSNHFDERLTTPGLPMEVEEFNRLNELEYGEGLTPETPEVIAAAIHSGQPAAQRTPASQAAQTAAQRTGETSRKLLLFTFIGSGCCALPAIILVIEVFASHSWSATEGRINSEVNPLRMLAISTVITFVTTKTISITVYLLAFFVAAKWLIASHRNHPTAERPTPSQ